MNLSMRSIFRAVALVVTLLASGLGAVTRPDLNTSNPTRATYSASSAAFASASSGTDIFTIYGSASKTITVRRIVVTGTQTTAGTINVFLVKRSTANTGGTSASVTAVPQDSVNPAATATILSYTANPTGLGTAVGNVRASKMFVPAPATATNQSPLISWDFGLEESQGLILRGASQGLCVNLSGVTVTGNSWIIWVVWMEE